MKVRNTFRHHYEPVHQSPRMKVFALGLDENQKAEQRENDLKDTKIPIDSVSSGVPLQTPIVLAKAPRRHFTGFTCGLLSWFIGACCLVLLCLAISEVAYHRQRDQAFLRLKWAELRQRMMGYELLSQQQELDRMALEKQSPVESLPLRRSDDPIKPKIVDAVQPSQDSPKTDYAEEQTEKFGFLQALMDKIRKHAQSMGLNGDMQVHVVEVKPIGFGGQNNKENSVEENASFEQSLADGFGEYAMPHQDFGPINDAYDNERLTFDRHSMRRPFGPFNRFDGPQIYDDYEQQPQEWNGPQFGFQQQPANWWGPRQEVQTNQWFPQAPVAFQAPAQQPWYQPYNNEQAAPFQPQNDEWMAQKRQQIPFQPNPVASDFNAPMDVIADDAPPPSTAIASEKAISPDQSLEAINDGKFLPIRSDDKPIDAADAHLFQIDDPSSFRR